MIVGLSGYARVGKDEVAKILVDEFGFTRVSWADKLRECAYELNPIVGVADVGYSDVLEAEFEVVYLQEVIDEYGWDGYKSTEWATEIRRLLQRMGTEVGRGIIKDSIWIDLTLAGMEEGKNYVIPDCRFPNERQAIFDRNGIFYRVEREGVGPINDHPSETSLDGGPVHGYILNNGTLDELRAKVMKKFTENWGL